ncbi:hypothetical protein ACFY04_39775 [Streptomyces sp. NPDC001549]|uniref:hypothetical protein n=1 Tax=Streptomyces sp. NPDC001549 TaxID=3364586 RepID=UPI0036A69DA3
MQHIVTAVSDVLAANPAESTAAGLAAAVIGPPLIKRTVEITAAYWAPKVTRFRRAVAEHVAPKDPGSPMDDHGQAS